MALSVASGTYTGNATDNRNITGLGFQPKFVIIKRTDSTGGASGIANWQDSDLSWYYGDNTTPMANYIQDFAADGFQLGTGAEVNANSAPFHWFALGGDDTEIKAGSYTGNGTDNRDITGVGFTPDMVFIHGAGNTNPCVRFGSETGDDSFTNGGGQGTTAGNGIQGFNSDGFQIGTSAQVNTNSTTYYYVAIRSISGAFKTGTYTGNGSDNRDITGLGLTPSVVFISYSVATYNSLFRTSSHTGDESTILQNGVANGANYIQSFSSGSFQIGSDTRVNTNTGTYYYFAATTSSAAPTFIPHIVGII